MNDERINEPQDTPDEGFKEEPKYIPQDTQEISLEGLGGYPSYATGETEEPEAPQDFTQSYYTEEERIDEEDVKRIVNKAIRDNKPRFRWMKAITLVLVGAVLGSFIGPLITARLPKEVSALTAQPAQTVSIQPTAEANVESAVAQKAAPSVVGVSTSVELRNAFLYGTQTVQGIGSGVILTEDGYILTNSHVISDGEAKDVSILFSDGQEASAELLWNDSTVDLAILKADRTGLTPIEIGTSEGVKVGDKAIAIGNPLGLELQSTLTSGYISGLNRSITFENGNTMDGLLQTDAAINSGNSGGALLNAQGQLIGINTAKNSVAEGIGFAIPIDTAKPVIDSILQTGTFTTPILGFQGYDYATFKRMNQIESGPDEGAIVMEVVPGTPASKELQRYDIITAIDGTPIENMGTLKKVLFSKKAGETVTLTIIRNDVEETVQVELIEREQAR